MEGQAMTRVLESTPPETVFVPGRWRFADGAAGGLLRMSCHAIHAGCRDGGTPWIVRVAGEVDCTTSEELREEIKDLLTTDHPDRLILDLEGVTHMDSSGLGTLLAGLRDANNRHVRFTLSGLSRSLRHTLERTRLDSLFEIHPTIQEALLK
jgi:anti-sigma B factor antagonist